MPEACGGATRPSGRSPSSPPDGGRALAAVRGAGRRREGVGPHRPRRAGRAGLFLVENPHPAGRAAPRPPDSTATASATSTRVHPHLARCPAPVRRPPRLVDAASGARDLLPRQAGRPRRQRAGGRARGHGPRARARRALEAGRPIAAEDFEFYAPPRGAHGLRRRAGAPRRARGRRDRRAGPGTLEPPAPRGRRRASTETYLVGTDRKMRNHSRFERRRVLRKAIDTFAAREALAGNTGVAEARDYRGVPRSSPSRPSSSSGSASASSGRRTPRRRSRRCGR